MINRTTFKVNRPNYQTKSGFVEKTLEKQGDINKFFCSNPNPDALQVENIITQYMSTILRNDETKDIIKKVGEEYTRRIEDLKKLRGEFMKPGDENYVYVNAWILAYQKANEKFDKYYRGKGNELRIGVICESGFTDKEELIYFDDAEAVAEESDNVTKEAVLNG